MSTGNVLRFSALACFLIAVVLISGPSVAQEAVAQESATQEKMPAPSRLPRLLMDKLAAPMTSIVDGRPFHQGIHRIADQAKVNVWISRQVDPSRLIHSGSLGPTVYLAIKKLAADHDCVVMPTRQVLLVGRSDWVDQVASIVQLAPASAKSNVSWPRLTTPSDALLAVTSLSASQAATQSAHPTKADASPLPHDLWPAVNWQGIEPTVAALLIRSQFATPSDETFDDRDTSQYRKSARRRQAIDRKLSLAAKKANRGHAKEATFSLTTKTRAADVLQQLAQAAGRPCVIDPSAKESCDQVVSVSATDVTLRELIELVAQQAGVTVTWEENRVIIATSQTQP